MTANTRTPIDRRVELEFEVPGTPQQVWHAIATGPGISSWLFPADVDEREGGAIAFRVAPGMDSAATVTRWEPPRRFGYEEREWSPGAPPLGTEFIIEARSGGTCTVRIVHSLFTDSAEWDDQIESFETGWRSFIDVLRLYLTRFFKEPCSPFRIMQGTDASESEAWNVLEAEFLPAVGGRPQPRTSSMHPHETLLVLDAPAPAIVLAGAYTWGNKVHASISFYFFGPGAASAAAREEARWKTWIEQTFA